VALAHDLGGLQVGLQDGQGDGVELLGVLAGVRRRILVAAVVQGVGTSESSRPGPGGGATSTGPSSDGIGPSTISEPTVPVTGSWPPTRMSRMFIVCTSYPDRTMLKSSTATESSVHRVTWTI
jgi:hypothetical protein